MTVFENWGENVISIILYNTNLPYYTVFNNWHLSFVIGRLCDADPQNPCGWLYRIQKQGSAEKRLN